MSSSGSPRWDSSLPFWWFIQAVSIGQAEAQGASPGSHLHLVPRNSISPQKVVRQGGNVLISLSPHPAGHSGEPLQVNKTQLKLRLLRVPLSSPFQNFIFSPNTAWRVSALFWGALGEVPNAGKVQTGVTGTVRCIPHWAQSAAHINQRISALCKMKPLASFPMLRLKVVAEEISPNTTLQIYLSAGIRNSWKFRVALLQGASKGWHENTL